MDADEGLSHALAGASPQAITARYGFDYDTDFLHIIWAFIPNVMLLNLNYGDTDHHIRIEFNNNSQTYKFTENELKQPKAFGSLAENGIALQLEAIYDGSTLTVPLSYSASAMRMGTICIFSSKLINKKQRNRNLSFRLPRNETSKFQFIGTSFPSIRG